MTTIQTKRVYHDLDSADGFRVFVDRLWPRGVRKDLFHYDLWAKNAAPSPALRKWYHEDPETHWTEFENRYTFELNHSDYTAEFLDILRQHDAVTLLYAAHDPVQNHAEVLKSYLEKRLSSL